MDSRIIDYLIHDLTDGTQHICMGRKELLCYAKEIGCTIDKNKLSRITCPDFTQDGDLNIESNTTHKIYCIEELAKWEN